MLTWFLARAERDAAAVARSKQSPRQAGLARRSRETYDAAEHLSFTAERDTARATLHREGIALALAAYADVPETFAPASVVAALPAGAPRFVTDAAVALEQKRGDVTELRHLHGELLDVVETPARLGELAQRLPFLRLGRLGVGLALALALGPSLVGWLTSPRNLARWAEWTTSSTAFACHPSHHECGGGRTDIFFHTSNEANPWLRYDLGSAKTVSGLTIVNRQDSLQARAVPLVVEVGDDGTTFREVARQTTAFSTWEPRFEPVAARFVRLRVDGTSVLHLERVEVHP
ncbi:MAG: discoidin domain-containing protein [Archangiaceae bacterium]|nr:discoidin domain-containing protein [Archangiaceae bacterium]